MARFVFATRQMHIACDLGCVAVSTRPDPASATVQIGGVVLDRKKAFTEAATYVSGTGTYAYPAYDSYEAGSDPDHLSDGDLLAPVLLNVRPSVKAFYSLQRIRPELEEWLAGISVNKRLEDVDDADLKWLGKLFSLVDPELPGVRGTTLAKVMHRKRPNFVPLYDQFVWHTYVAAPTKRVPRKKRRSWADFIPLLAHAMQEDLHREASWFDDIAGTAYGPSITRLRALDIVAWRAGKDLAVPGHHVGDTRLVGA